MSRYIEIDSNPEAYPRESGFGALSTTGVLGLLLLIIIVGGAAASGIEDKEQRFNALFGWVVLQFIGFIIASLA